jgi:hypothetical protein
MKFPCPAPPPNLKNLMNFPLKNREFLTNEVFKKKFRFEFSELQGFINSQKPAKFILP